MLSTMRRSWLLFALLAIVALASAISVEDFRIDGVAEYLHHGKRQRPSGTGSPDTTDPSQTPVPPPDDEDEPPSSTPPPPPPPTSSSPPPPPPPTTSDDPPEPTESSQPPSSNSPPPPPPTNRPTSDNNEPPTPTPTSSRTTPVTTPIVRSTPLVSTEVQQYTTVFKTVTNGQTLDVTSVGQRTREITTGQAFSTEMPLPQNGDGESGSGGLSDSNKKIIGGVVGGVGGAILLGGIAIVLWRVYGRKNRVAEDDDDLMANTGAALGDKPHSSSTNNTPFQSNLEQYHNPGGRPNAAANF